MKLFGTPAAAFFLLIVWVAGALAEVVIPNKPKFKDVPKFNSQGERVSGFRLNAASVIKLPDGDVLAMSGYAIANRGGDADAFLWNRKIGLSCEGRTEMQPDQSGKGSLACSLDGAELVEIPVLITADKYFQDRAIVTKMTLPVEGGTLSSVMSWQRGKSPSFQSLVDQLP